MPAQPLRSDTVWFGGDGGSGAAMLGRDPTLTGSGAGSTRTRPIGATAYAYDLADGPQGWSFERCAGVGVCMAVHPQADWYDWVDAFGAACECGLSGSALGLVDAQHSPFSPPGLAPGQKGQACSGVVPRAGHGPPVWNRACASHDVFSNNPMSTGAHYRPGWKTYAYTTEQNPVPHGSGRHGQAAWYSLASPRCARTLDNLSTRQNEPLPVDWDSIDLAGGSCGLGVHG